MTLRQQFLPTFLSSNVLRHISDAGLTQVKRMWKRAEKPGKRTRHCRIGSGEGVRLVKEKGKLDRAQSVVVWVDT